MKASRSDAQTSGLKLHDSAIKHIPDAGRQDINRMVCKC